jgi:hypothetical protein
LKDRSQFHRGRGGEIGACEKGIGGYFTRGPGRDYDLARRILGLVVDGSLSAYHLTYGGLEFAGVLFRALPLTIAGRRDFLPESVCRGP